MTPKNQRTDLPEIPSLPPIQMPDTSNLYAASPYPKHSDVSSSSRYPSSSPFASQDTFLTAPSSPSPDPSGTPPNGSPDYLSPTASRSFTLPPPLRKSISVDSFVKSTKSSSMPSRPVPPGPAATDVHPSQDASPFSSNTVRQYDATGLSHASSTGHDKRTLHNSVPARSRGISVSTIDDRDGPPYDESDMERSEDVIRRARKGKGTSRQFVSPGELPLPSRLQSKGSSPTMSKSSAAIVPARSSSLNHRLAKQKSLMSVNTHIPMPHQLPEICLVVVGAAGCGKSTFIRKGLKAYGLSESESISIHPSPTGPEDEIFTYTLRTGKIPASQDTPERLLRVLEVDVSALDIQGPHKIWPGLTPSWDAALICYDASNEESFIHVEDIMGAFGDLKLPTVVLACKSELERRVDPSRASVILRPYDVGLVEISVATSQGKEKMRDTFDWLFRAIIENQSFGLRNGLRNPASPAVLTSPPPWEVARASSATPTASSANSSHGATLPHTPGPYSQTHTPSQSASQTPAQVRAYHLPLTGVTSPRTPSTPTSPTRARSTSDLLSEHEKSKREEREQHVGKLGMAGMRSRGSLHTHPGAAGSTDGLIHMDEAHDGTREISMKGSRAPPWMSLEDLLNKLLFMAVSDDDPVFVSHFLLTYRRFASPRAVLLAMQKRMRSLDQPTGDPMFACYAQMRICHLLDTWITLYPNDFAVHGAASALGALIKSILSKTYLLHYGSDFLPFLELVPSLKDEDAGWALKVEDESDDSSILDDEERSLMLDSESPVSTSPAQTFVDADAAHTPTTGFTQPSFTRERKASLPLTAKALVALNPATSPTNSMHESFLEHSPKQILRRLLAISQELQPLDPQVIAEEITRFEAAYFAKIEPRHWLQQVLVQGKKDVESDSIATYNRISNHIATWVVSLILCHEKPKARAKQIEKFVTVANRLRTIQNYSALRAIVAGINSATFEGDQALESFKSRNMSNYKSFQSWDQLLQSVRSHQKYRMALRNTKGACIPALEIHLSDLIRAHEGNPDYHDDDPNKIHWAKFNMMARFVDAITQCQKGCRESGGYDYPDREDIRKLFLMEEDHFLMDIDMQRSRLAPPDLEGVDDPSRPGLPRTYSRDSPHHSRDAAILRKIFFW